ncbi:MAG: hypothetical protein KDA71_03225 [Planctomycetales bacterium]|nr:hypothetical protein [Planctomycetales bacterium]
MAALPFARFKIALLLAPALLLLSVASFANGQEPTESAAGSPVFRAGAFAIDVSPQHFPVIVNGGMTERTADKIVDRLHARCLVLDDGTKQIAIAVVDSCMLPRDLLDQAKQMASQATGIPTSRMLISATHTHSAPASMGCLGSDPDPTYVAFLPGQIAKGIIQAQKNLAPARIGWAVSQEPNNVYVRRFLMKPGKANTTRFTGHTNDRAQMNPGLNNPNAIRRTGRPDTDVSVVSLQSPEGRPIALLANYSTHYAGSPAISADYFGVFCEKIAERIGANEASGDHPPFMAAMTNGTSGDANCVDFVRNAPRKFDYFSVAEDVAAAAEQAYRRIEYHDWAPIEMSEALLELAVRLPDEQELAEAKEFVATFADRKPKTTDEVYAREAVILSQLPPTRELKLQAIRLGELGIAAIPNEVYSITGLTIKTDSPFPTTFTIELANGAEGYIPTPDQHALGGYTTWRARTSCLEEQAEPKIRATVLKLLREVYAAARN